MHRVSRKNDGALAQVVEQWTENPCVPGSNPGGTTKRPYFSEGVFISNWALIFYLSPG